MYLKQILVGFILLGLGTYGYAAKNFEQFRIYNVTPKIVHVSVGEARYRLEPNEDVLIFVNQYLHQNVFITNVE